MMRVYKYGLFLGLLLAPAVATAQEARVVAVNTEKAVLQSDRGKAADSELTTLVEAKKKEFDAKKKEIDELKDKEEKQRLVLTEQALTELRRKITDLQKAFERGLEDTDRELDQKRTELLGPIVKAAKEQLDKLVAEKSYDIVIDLAGDGPAIFPYVNPKIEITEELVKRVNSVLKTSAVDAAKPETAAAKVAP